jgi:hypothetical protein
MSGTVKAFLNSHWKVKLLAVAIPLSAILTLMLALYPETTQNIIFLVLVVLLVLTFIVTPAAQRKAKPPMGLNKSGSFRTTWLQLESVFQFYLSNQVVFSFMASLFAFAWLAWVPLTVLVISSVFFPTLVYLALSAFRFDLEPTEPSWNKVKAAYISSLAEALINAGKTGDAIKYLKYSLKIMNDERQDSGYEYGSTQEIISLLGVIEAEAEDFPEAELKGLAAFLARGPSYRAYGSGLRSFLKRLTWKKEISFPKKEGGLSRAVRKVARYPLIGGVIGTLLSSFVLIFQDQIRQTVLWVYTQIVSHLNVNVDLLMNELVPSFLWIPSILFVIHSYSPALRYYVAWGDIAATM